MLKVCAKGHYECAFNTISTLHEIIECPACKAMDDKARLEDEVKGILDELHIAKRKLEDLEKAL